MDFSKDDLKQAFMDAMRESRGSFGGPTFKGDPIEEMAKFEAALKRNKASFGDITKGMLAGKAAFKDLTYQISDVEDKLEELADKTGEVAAEQREQLQGMKKELEITQKSNIAKKAFIDTVLTSTKALAGFGVSAVGIAARSMGNLANGLQSGASAFSLAGGVMNGAMDVANAGTQALAAGMSAVGMGMTQVLPGYWKILGVATTGLAMAFGGLADAATATGKFIVNFMVKQLEMTMESFNKLTAAGATFANGMTGMYDAADKAGLTITQLSNVVAKNTETFAASGMSITETVKMVGRVGQVMKATNMTDNLLRLGYGFEEQVQLVAETIADMRASRSDMIKDPAGIARATEEYAKNLRVISSITGEDARKKMEEVRGLATQAAFRAKLLELENQFPGTYQKTLAAMATMTPVMQKSVMEGLLLGQVINTEGAIMSSQSAAISEQIYGTVEAIKSGNLSTQKQLEENQQLQGKTNDMFMKQIDTFTQIGIAGLAGGMSELNKALSDQIRKSDLISEEGVRKAQQNAESLKTANDGLTTQMVEAAHTAQNFAITLQNLAKNELGQFALYTTAILGALDKALRDFYIEIGKYKGEDEGFWEAYGLDIAQGLLGAVMIGVGAIAEPFTLGGSTAIIGTGALGLGTASYDAYEKYQKRKDGGSSRIPSVKDGKTPDFSGVNTNGAQGYGQITPDLQAAITNLAKAQTDANNPLKGATISSANDATTFAPHRNSKHGIGRAMDITIPGYNAKVNDTDPTILKRSEAIKAAIIALGFKTVDDEYIKPSDAAIGGHFHAELKDGAIVSSKTGGVGVNVGEGGRDELITPLKNGMLPGMAELINEVKELVRVTKAHKDVSENISMSLI